LNTDTTQCYMVQLHTTRGIRIHFGGIVIIRVGGGEIVQTCADVHRGSITICDRSARDP